MNEENKNDVVDTNEEQKVTNEEQQTTTIDTETTEKSVKDAILETLSNIFKGDKTEEDNIIKDIVEEEIEDKSTITMTKEELDTYIAERAQATIDKMAKTAKEKGVEQANMMKKLEDVDPAFVDFIEYQLKQNKGMDINEFLNENPQYKKKITTKETITKETNGQTVFDKNQSNILDSF